MPQTKAHRRCAICRHYTEDLSVPTKKTAAAIKAGGYQGYCRRLILPTSRPLLRCGGDDYQPLP